MARADADAAGNNSLGLPQSAWTNLDMSPFWGGHNHAKTGKLWIYWDPTGAQILSAYNLGITAGTGRKPFGTHTQREDVPVSAFFGRVAYFEVN